MKQSNERPPVDSGTAFQFAATPAIASRLQSPRLVVRVAELGPTPLQVS